MKSRQLTKMSLLIQANMIKCIAMAVMVISLPNMPIHSIKTKKVISSELKIAWVTALKMTPTSWSIIIKNVASVMRAADSVMLFVRYR